MKQQRTFSPKTAHVSQNTLLTIIIAAAIIITVSFILFIIYTVVSRSQIEDINENIDQIEQEIDHIEEQIANITADGPYIPVAEKGVPDGVCPLNGSGIIPESFLPDIANFMLAMGEWDAQTNTPTLVSSSCSEGDTLWVTVGGSTVLDGQGPWYVGDILICFSGIWNRIASGNPGFLLPFGCWNAFTNSPTLVSGVCDEGDIYWVCVAGNTVLDGESTWLVGDLVVCFGGIWNRIPTGQNANTITSVNGQTGPAVNLFLDDIIDVLAPTPSAGDILYFGGAVWTNQNPAAYAVILSPFLDFSSGTALPALIISPIVGTTISFAFPFFMYYIRVGSIVQVSFSIKYIASTADPTWATFFDFVVPVLPGAPFGSLTDISGVGFTSATGPGGASAAVLTGLNLGTIIISSSGTFNARLSVIGDGPAAFDFLSQMSFSYTI